MQLEQSFDVPAAPASVWAALIDIQRVAKCLPGAEISDRNDDGSYNGTFNVKVGPTSASYTGRLVMEALDDDARTATMSAHGTDRRGQGSASATILSSVTALDDGASRVAVFTEYQITGRLARFGRGGMIEEIGNRLLREFGESLRELLAGEGASETAAKEPQAGPQATTEPEAGPQAASEPEAAAQPQPTAVGPAYDLSPAAPTIWSRARANAVPLIALLLGFLTALRVLRRRD